MLAHVHYSMCVEVRAWCSGAGSASCPSRLGRYCVFHFTLDYPGDTPVYTLCYLKRGVLDFRCVPPHLLLTRDLSLFSQVVYVSFCTWSKGLCIKCMSKHGFELRFQDYEWGYTRPTCFSCIWRTVLSLRGELWHWPTQRTTASEFLRETSPVAELFDKSHGAIRENGLSHFPSCLWLELPV